MGCPGRGPLSVGTLGRTISVCVRVLSCRLRLEGRKGGGGRRIGTSCGRVGVP